jgi:hypothetical protein
MLLTTYGLAEDQGPRLDASLLSRSEHETCQLAHAKLAAKIPGDAEPRSQLAGGCPSRPCGSGPPRKPRGWDEERGQPSRHRLALSPTEISVVVSPVWIRERRLQVPPASAQG